MASIYPTSAANSPALSLGEGLYSGYYGAREMAEPVTLIWSDAWVPMPLPDGEHLEHTWKTVRDDQRYRRLLYEAPRRPHAKGRGAPSAWLVTRRADAPTCIDSSKPRVSTRLYFRVVEQLRRRSQHTKAETTSADLGSGLLNRHPNVGRRRKPSQRGLTNIDTLGRDAFARL